MAMLTKVVHELCSDEPAAANYHDLHVLNHLRLLMDTSESRNRSTVNKSGGVDVPYAA
jgi:hypothetical protein